MPSPPLQSRRSGYSAINKAKGQVSGPAPRSLKRQQLKPLTLSFLLCKMSSGKMNRAGESEKGTVLSVTPLNIKNFQRT